MEGEHLGSTLDFSKIFSNFFAVGVPLVGGTQIVSAGHEVERDSKQKGVFASLPELVFLQFVE